MKAVAMHGSGHDMKAVAIVWYEAINFPLPFCLFPPVPYIRLAILSYLRFGLRGADNIAVPIEKSAMRPEAVMARADYLRDGPSFPIEQKKVR